MLHFALPFHCSASFNFQALFFAFWGLNTAGSSLAFSVLFCLLCYFNILFLFMALCLFIVNSVYYANKLG